jgi:hypothetical protein
MEEGPVIKTILLAILIAAVSACVEVDDAAFSPALEEEGKIYIVDRTGHKWDITQAVSLGFKPEKFQYGLGKDAFTPLDDTFLAENSGNVRENLRVIGVEEGIESRAYSVPRLSGHEISNSMLGIKPIAVGY